MVAACLRQLTFSGALRAALCAPALFLGATPCDARPWEQEAAYPVKPIRMVVASPPGAADDLFARAVGRELERFYGQRVVIDNRTGAGGLIGNTLVSRANADGYTLGMVGVTRLITELMRDPPPYRARSRHAA